MFRILLLLAAVVLFVIAALGAFGSVSGINHSRLLAVGLACVAAGVPRRAHGLRKRRATNLVEVNATLDELNKSLGSLLLGGRKKCSVFCCF